MMDQIKDWLLAWFLENVDTAMETKWDNNYVEIGIIDSFQFLGLVADVENFFGITFAEEDLMDEAILTARGIAEKIRCLTEQDM